MVWCITHSTPASHTADFHCHTSPVCPQTSAIQLPKSPIYPSKRPIYAKKSKISEPYTSRKKTNIPAKETNISANCEIIGLLYHLFLTHLRHGQLPLSRQPVMSAKEPYIAAKEPYISAKEMRPIFVLNTNVFYRRRPVEILYVRKRGQYIRKKDQYNRKRDMCICKTEKDPHTLPLVRQVEIL